MAHRRRNDCEYVRTMALDIETIGFNLDNNLYPGEFRFAMSKRLQELKPEFMQNFYDHECHDCLGRLSMVAFDIETEARSNSADKKLADVIQLHEAA